MALIDDWSGSPIESETSAGGTLLISNVYDALMRPIEGVWPPPALVMQLGDGESRTYPFSRELRELVSGEFGHYCAMQSINSEDALTWNFFGTLMYAPEEQRATALNSLCEMADTEEAWGQNTRCAIDVWRRIPHPYYPSADGPELDAVLAGDRCVVFVEAKWLSPEGTGRGPGGTRVGQLHLRQQFFQRWGRAMYGERGMLVLGVSLTGQLATNHGPDEHGVAVRSATWSQLATYEDHPNGDEFGLYLAWKTQHSHEASRRLAAAENGQKPVTVRDDLGAIGADGCMICGAEKQHPLAYACPRCKRILDRVETRKDADGAGRKVNRQARIRAMQESWYDGTFHCYYTGVSLVEDSARWRDHRYIAFEHQTPGDEASVVVTCALVNRIKTDLTDPEFRIMVAELAKAFEGGEFDEGLFPEGKLPGLGG